MNIADLGEDQQALFAIIRAVEILGEAASRITSETRKANPHIPWRYIIAMRNRLIHGYFDIDAENVWNTESNELPLLISQRQEMIEG